MPCTCSSRSSSGLCPSARVRKCTVNPRPGELLQEQHLVGVLAGEAVRGVDVERVQAAGCLPRPARRSRAGRHQGGPAGALVDEAAGRGQRLAVLGDARLQGGDLAGDGAVLGLLFRGDTGVNGNPQRRHVYLRAGRRE